MEQTVFRLVKLIKHRLRPDLDHDVLPVSMEQEEIQKLMDVAQMHDLTTIVGSELIDQKLISSGELFKNIQKNVCKEAVRCEMLCVEQDRLHQLLEAAQIPFVPLKGADVRQYYPEPWLRTSCDIDILVHKEDLNKAMAVLLENGCTMYGEKNYHDVSLVTPGKKLLELHFCLREDISVLDCVLDRAWQYTKNAPGKQYEHRLQNGFLLFYLIAHMAFHCRFGGCGIRSFVDIWLLQDQMEYDRELFGQLCCEAQLDRFYDNVLQLIDVWFNGQEHTAITKELAQVVISGGTFGSLDNRILIDQAQTGGKGKRLLKRIFMPYEGLKTQYPILISHRWLTPVFQVVRWFRIFTGDRLRRAIREYKTSRSHSAEQVNKAKSFLKDVGLDF